MASYVCGTYTLSHVNVSPLVYHVPKSQKTSGQTAISLLTELVIRLANFSNSAVTSAETTTLFALPRHKLLQFVIKGQAEMAEMAEMVEMAET